MAADSDHRMGTLMTGQRSDLVVKVYAIPAPLVGPFITRAAHMHLYHAQLTEPAITARTHGATSPTQVHK